MDWKFILANVLPVSVLFSLIPIWFTRKNIKTSKYIETITTERLKWLSIVRNDLTELLTWVMILDKNNDYLANLRSDVIGLKENMAYFDDLDPTLASEYGSEFTNVKEKLVEIENEYRHGLSRREIVGKAILLKLMFNPDKDYEILAQLDLIIKKFSIFNAQENEIKIDLDKIVLASQRWLKSEWDIVKSEVDKK